VLNVSPKVYPSAWNLHSEESIEEDRRVLYVALTRAKNELYITRDTNSINTVNNSDNSSDASSKYFLEKLPENLIDQIINPFSIIKPRDILTPNKIDLSTGMDFS
jgi:DNA helicase-2/ATP-dependent DNA helicase PcrA